MEVYMLSALRRPTLGWGLCLLAILLAGGISSPAFADPEAILRAWPGTYEGWNDGRRAVLTLTETRRTGERAYYALRLRDVERGVEFRGEASSRANRSAHRLRDIRMTAPGGQEIRIERLLLHTWNTDFVSGVARSSGHRYGLVFGRDGFTARMSRGPLGSDRFWPCRWIGEYDGRLDGRDARLSIRLVLASRRSVSFALALTDVDRGVTWSRSSLVVGRSDPLRELDSLHLRTESGADGHVHELLLHTWNTAYISGRTRSDEIDYGLGFKLTSNVGESDCRDRITNADRPAPRPEPEPETPTPEPERDSSWKVDCLCRNARGTVRETIRACAAPPEVPTHFNGLNAVCGLLAADLSYASRLPTTCAAVAGSEEHLEREACPFPGGALYQTCPGGC
jgi:hypothetical protein